MSDWGKTLDQPRCKCGRFVKRDDVMPMDSGIPPVCDECIRRAVEYEPVTYDMLEMV